jgi:hypothetical protein
MLRAVGSMTSNAGSSSSSALEVSAADGTATSAHGAKHVGNVLANYVNGVTAAA